jgi:hypothetical protein
MSGRKRAFTKGEALNILDEYDRKFTAAATHLCEQFLGGSGLKEYKKRHITDPNLSSDTRRPRVKEMRAEFEKWCQSLGCSTVQLCRLFIHLDSYTEQHVEETVY